MALTMKQRRRASVIADRMSHNGPVNPMDMAAVTRKAEQNRKAAGLLSWVLTAAEIGFEAAEVDELLDEAEAALAPAPPETRNLGGGE